MIDRFTVASIPAFVPDVRRPYECALVFPAVFSERQCDRILGQVADLATDDAHVGDGVDSPDGIRRSRVAWLPADESHTWIYDKLAAIVARANRRYQFDLLGFTEELQFTEYGDGAFYTWHQDGLDGDLAVRKLSIVTQLSDPDDYAGGALEFFALEGSEPAEMQLRGTVVVFPSFEFHRVTPVTRGTRRSLVCWIGGPAFR